MCTTLAKLNYLIARENKGCTICEPSQAPLSLLHYCGSSHLLSTDSVAQMFYLLCLTTPCQCYCLPNVGMLHQHKTCRLSSLTYCPLFLCVVCVCVYIHTHTHTHTHIYKCNSPTAFTLFNPVNAVLVLPLYDRIIFMSDCLEVCMEVLRLPHYSPITCMT